MRIETRDKSQSVLRTLHPQLAILRSPIQRPRRRRHESYLDDTSRTRRRGARRAVRTHQRARVRDGVRGGKHLFDAMRRVARETAAVADVIPRRCV